MNLGMFGELNLTYFFAEKTSCADCAGRCLGRSVSGRIDEL